MNKSQVKKVIKDRILTGEKTDFVDEKYSKIPMNTETDFNKTLPNWNPTPIQTKLADLEFENLDIDIQAKKAMDSPTNSNGLKYYNSQNTTAVTLLRNRSRTNSYANSSDLGKPDEILNNNSYAKSNEMIESIDNSKNKNRFIKNIVNNFIMVNERFSLNDNILQMKNKKF